MDHDGSTFLCGCAVDIELFFFAKSLDRLVDQGTENSSFFMMLDGDWYKYKFGGAWTAVSMGIVKALSKADRLVVAVSPRGAYWEVMPDSRQETNGQIKEWNYPLRSLTPVEDVLYACGMGRTVLRRIHPGAWEEIGPGSTKEDDGLIVGFEDLTAFSAKEMYAVGWRGEIWQYLEELWRRLDSPVSANLNAACCAADGRVYVVGDNGTLLRGRNDVWEILETERMDNLMDVASFGEQVYVTTDFEILKLKNDTLVPEDAFTDPNDVPASCLHLFDAKDGLISMGTKDVFRLKGAAWERLV